MLFECGAEINTNENNTIKPKKSENMKEQIYQVIKNAPPPGISANDIAEELNIEKKKVEDILLILDKECRISKTKADGMDKLTGQRFGCLIYSNL